MYARLAKEIHAPILESVGGSMDAGSAMKLNAGKLSQVGGDLNTKNARDFHNRSIATGGVGGKWEIHPDAKSIRQGIKGAHANQPRIEI